MFVETENRLVYQSKQCDLDMTRWLGVTFRLVRWFQAWNTLMRRRRRFAILSSAYMYDLFTGICPYYTRHTQRHKGLLDDGKHIQASSKGYAIAARVSTRPAYRLLVHTRDCAYEH